MIADSKNKDKNMALHFQKLNIGHLFLSLLPCSFSDSFDTLWQNWLLQLVSSDTIFADCKFKVVTALQKCTSQRFNDLIIKFQTENDLLVTTATLIARLSQEVIVQ